MIHLMSLIVVLSITHNSASLFFLTTSISFYITKRFYWHNQKLFESKFSSKKYDLMCYICNDNNMLAYESVNYFRNKNFFLTKLSLLLLYKEEKNVKNRELINDFYAKISIEEEKIKKRSVYALLKEAKSKCFENGVILENKDIIFLPYIARLRVYHQKDKHVTLLGLIWAYLEEVISKDELLEYLELLNKEELTKIIDEENEYREKNKEYEKKVVKEDDEEDLYVKINESEGEEDHATNIFLESELSDFYKKFIKFVHNDMIEDVKKLSKTLGKILFNIIKKNLNKE